ncbi:MAG: hypothetical protein PHT33_03085 [bacterium]|nr:hypothetical protein [bacterium]
MMAKNSMNILVSVLLLLTITGVAGADLPTTLYSYTQGFESTDPVAFWTSNGSYTINFKGLTNEQIYSGLQSFKLDVTFGTGATYVYFMILLPQRIPAYRNTASQNDLHFTGHVFLGTETTCRAGLGFNYAIFPLDFWTGCSPTTYYCTTKGEWETVDENVVDWWKGSVDRFMPLNFTGVTGDNVGGYINRIGLFLFGSSGQRAVVYLDGINLTGYIPSQADYEGDTTTNKWPSAVERINAKIADWQTQLQTIDAFQ